MHRLLVPSLLTRSQEWAPGPGRVARRASNLLPLVGRGVGSEGGNSRSFSPRQEVGLVSLPEKGTGPLGKVVAHQRSDPVEPKAVD